MGIDVKPQKRSRKIAMSTQELDEFLSAQWTCRVATTGPNGPHVSPLWFLWHDECLWMTSIVRSQRWTDIQRDPRISVLIDAGTDYRELRGAELIGRAQSVGEVPRTGEAHPELEKLEPLFAQKYYDRDEMSHDQRHAWLRLNPHKIVSWDFRKLASLGK
jgi:nitroimidazol reductase NimA-like FMN-containing flavoprotein (pyridoxamine 5'-phosphate oxidase superfamily)